MAKISTRTKLGMLAALCLLAACLVLIFSELRKFEYAQVYHPSKDVVHWNFGADVGRKEVYFSTKGGAKLDGWFFPADADSPRKSMAILVCHGNSGNLTYLEALYTRLAETGANVLLFDYRGYGKSEGEPSEEGTYRDAQAAYQWLRQSGFAATNIFVYGESLGGAIAAELVLREPAGGLILEGAPTSIADMGSALFPWLPVRLLNHLKYDTHAKMSKVKVPLLVMHSREDKLVPFRMAQQNYGAASGAKMFWELKGGHVSAGEEYHEGMEKFLTAMEIKRSH